MDKRTIMVVIACMLALFALQKIVEKIYPPIPKKPKPVATNAVPAVTNTVAEIKPPPPPVELPVASAPEKTVSLSNNLMRVEFTSRGGGIRLVELLEHKANSHGHAVLNGPAFPPALSLAGGTNDEFEIQQPDARTVVMRDEAGLTKTFSLSNDYLIAGSVQAPAAKDFQLVVGTATPTQPREVANYLVVDWQGAPKFRNRTQPRVADKVKAGKPYEEIRAGWVAVKSQYFAMVLTPTTNIIGVGYASVTVTSGPPPEYGVSATASVPADGKGACAFTYYVGPKDYNRLVALGGHQEELMDFGTPMDFYSGIFGFLLVRSLNFFYRLIPSYGIAIILVTIALKVIFWPIQAKSIKSMKQMQKFQPQLAKLKEKYKDDAARLNQETMKLYKEHGINPFSGCLPMLVQMPVLFAFYRVLVSDIALRGAAFLWIKDLAQPDTVAMVAGIAINPLPLLMVVTMIWQQKLTPQTGDAQQQKMMMFMPLMMLLFFYKAAAGLTLYWTLQQLLSVLQQWWGMRKEKLAAGISQ